MGHIIKIENESLRSALKTATRQYLVGNLARPQTLTFLRDERLEVGVSCYPHHMTEPAHVHATATEYQYMLSGWTEYMDVSTGETYEFRKGDFYAILPGTPYAQREKAGTETS